ncbi:MAG: ligase-associated DNA damage response exonuclease [Parachlamydiaceae bacterium]|nr:ligase-associated DNA damage response exonuclease [Parachlamydiaceae bacterium]
MDELLAMTKNGLFCPQGNFYIDPLLPVPLALLTHAHGDHARRGSNHYMAQRDSLELLEYRLGSDISLKTVGYREKVKLGNVWVSFHPAGHILGSSQIRIEHGSRVAVASGDYKRALDGSCEPFELLPCDLFVTESTFGLPIYHWKSSEESALEICQWWQSNAELGRPSVLFCYSLGKAQRVLHLLKALTDREIFIHGSIAPINACYEKHGVELAKTQVVTHLKEKRDYSHELIMAPLSAFRSPWMRRFKNSQTAFASGWMAVRGTKRRRGFDKGFVLSDHADWNDLIDTVQATGARKVWVTHGFTETLARYLREKNQIDATPLAGFVQQEED